TGTLPAAALRVTLLLIASLLTGAFFLTAAFFAVFLLAGIHTLRESFGSNSGATIYPKPRHWRNRPDRLSRQYNGVGRLPPLRAVFCDHGRVDAAAHVELGRQAHEARGGRSDEVRENLVRDRLVERALVAEAPHIELQ